MRTKDVILEEIKKVAGAKKAAHKKIERCDIRLDELESELKKVEEVK